MRISSATILIIALLIVSIGIISIYSSTYQKDTELWRQIYRRQIYWVCIGIIFFLLMANFNYRRLWDWTYLFYALVLCLLILVFILGIVRLGAQRWLKFAWINFQPSELAKLVMVIFLSRYFSSKSVNEVSPVSKRSDLIKGLVLPFLFVALPLVLIIEQPDLGSGLMIFFIFLGLVYVSGVKLRYIVLFLLVIVLLSPAGWHLLRDYQRDRLLVFLNPNIDPLGAGYTVIQSKIAIGSGGIFGKGWLSGTQSQLKFLPESHTDFIFATFSEEWGFLGSSVLLTLYYLLVRCGLTIAHRTADFFGKLLALGISLMLAIQVIVNLAMNMGLAPVVGIPLPLMSYGGSSMLVTFSALGILANIDKDR